MRVDVITILYARVVLILMPTAKVRFSMELDPRPQSAAEEPGDDQ